jgi:antitoxin component HigA of HigAB toxin-antitoxin module
MSRSRQSQYEGQVKVQALMLKALAPFDGPSVVGATEFRREQYGLTMSEMAQVLGMAKAHYSEFINGKRELPVSAMVRAFAIGIPAECLFQIEKEQP